MLGNISRTWIEISRAAVRHNVSVFRRLLSKRTQLWAVVKSNAYGHGIFTIPTLFDAAGVDGFCVDSIIEGVRLRERGIEKLILVLGLTLPDAFALAKEHDITITISSFDILRAFLHSQQQPKFHLKLDTGMHRQGFYIADLPKVITASSHQPSAISHLLTGVYTHFASAKDINYPTYTELQFKEYERAVALLRRAGFRQLLRHVAATGGAMIDSRYHLDAVRVGAGLYGIWPSKELEIQFDNFTLSPVLSWHTIVGEVKRIRRGEYVGYNMAYRAQTDAVIAILPIGYWHGFPFALSGSGVVLIRGKVARVIGRVSMDMIAVDVSHITRCRFGDEVVIIGKQGKEFIGSDDVARFIGASHNYEVVTRINPLIERRVV